MPSDEELMIQRMQEWNDYQPWMVGSAAVGGVQGSSDGCSKGSDSKKDACLNPRYLRTTDPQEGSGWRRGAPLL